LVSHAKNDHSVVEKSIRVEIPHAKEENLERVGYSRARERQPEKLRS
jgi:hypothetical protein